MVTYHVKNIKKKKNQPDNMKKLITILMIIMCMASCKKEDVQPTHPATRHPLTISAYVSKNGYVPAICCVTESVYINGVLKNTLSSTNRNSVIVTDVVQFGDTVQVGDSVSYTMVFYNPYTVGTNQYYSWAMSMNTTISLIYNSIPVATLNGDGFTDVLSVSYIVQ